MTADAHKDEHKPTSDRSPFVASDDYADLDGIALAELVSTGQVSSREIIDNAIARPSASTRR